MGGEFGKELTEVTVAVPSAWNTSSQYVLIQSLARGEELGSYVQQMRGKIAGVLEWREKIYRTILLAFGYLVLEHGFFQSDPHTGNWFWDAEEQTLTLTDWGGVDSLETGDLSDLASVYSSYWQ